LWGAKLQFDIIAKKIISAFDEKTEKREELIKTGRDLLRLSTLAVKKIHHNEESEAKKLLDEAAKLLCGMNAILEQYPDIGSAFVAIQEYVEAMIFYSIIYNDKILTPEEMNVSYNAYLNGVGDVIGEFRRKFLDSLISGDFAAAKKYFDIMNELYDFISLFDHPKSITSSLRRKQDIARGLIEKTRSELTIASIEDRISEKKG